MYIESKEQLLKVLDDFIGEIKGHSGYRDVFTITENPMIQMISLITGYQPGYFAKPMNNGEYVVFDLEKIQNVREILLMDEVKING